MTNARLALIKNGIVQHVISVDADVAIFTEEANAGWLLQPDGILAAPPPEPEPEAPEEPQNPAP